MKLVNAVALLCLLIFVAGDLAHVLPRTDTLQTRDLVIHLVFDLGAIALLAFSGWCMFLRGPQPTAAGIRMLISLALQLVLLTAVAFFALDPFEAFSQPPAQGDALPGLLTSLAILSVPLGLIAVLMRWSARANMAPSVAPVARAKRVPKAETEGEGETEYYEPIPELMGDRYREPQRVIIKEPTPHLRFDHPAALIGTIPPVRAATCALLRVQASKPSGAKKAKTKAKFEASVVGTATCIVGDRYLITAHQVLNSGQARRPEDRFYAVIAPVDGSHLFHFPVVGFPVENPDLDLAVLEIGPCANGVEHLGAMPLTLDRVPDGAQILTMGYPSPLITDLEIDPDGEYLDSTMQLRPHANSGIIAAQSTDSRGDVVFEFNVAWHHGESGGPAVRLDPSPALFAVMTDYRSIQGPRGGVMAGPYQGRSLKPLESALREFGATFV